VGLKFIGKTLINPVMNGACSIAKSDEDLEAMLATRQGAVLIGSITPEPRDGNPEPRWFDGQGQPFALNSFGMPNNGHDWYLGKLPLWITKTHDAGKLLALSVAGFSIDDYIKMARLAKTVGVDWVEFNFGCPNTAEAGRSNPIFSFDLEVLAKICEEVEKVLGDLPYTVKLSPYSNPAELNRTAAVIAKTKAAAVVTSNTFPNGYWQDDGGRPVIGPNDGLAGTSGEAILAIALGQVRQFRNALPSSIEVIGVGGITKPEHVKQYLNAGAKLVQTATHIVRHGHAAIDELVEAA
jgi:dihydroorotate dehydrogenase (fumarate)